MKVTWQLVQNWLVFEVVIAIALVVLPSRLLHSLRETWLMPTFGPVAAILMALMTLGFATLIALLGIYMSIGMAQALGLVPKKS